MKLGFAKSRMVQIDSKLESLMGSISKCPRSRVDESLNEVNALLTERQDLSSRITSTERTTVMGGNSLDEIYKILVNLHQRIKVLNVLEERSDLTDIEEEMLYLQLSEFGKTRDNLNILVEKTLWETDLISF